MDTANYQYSSYEKYSSAPPPPVQGIPINSTAGQHYHTEDSRPKNDIPWSSGLCDCFSDCGNCCMTFWCPCVTFGRIAEILDKGSSSCGVHAALYTLLGCVGCPCVLSCIYRSKMRQQFLLEGSSCGDCLRHCCCECCALGQEYRELKHRGYDLTIGWQGNVAKQNRTLEMASAPPVVEGGMSR